MSRIKVKMSRDNYFHVNHIIGKGNEREEGIDIFAIILHCIQLFIRSFSTQFTWHTEIEQIR